MTGASRLLYGSGGDRPSGDERGLIMPNIIFVTPDGAEHQVAVEDGVTVMEAGRDAGLGIEGTCGGCLSCATCHVIVDKDWHAKLPAPSEDEEDMLDLAFGLTRTSRLGCQMTIAEGLDGLRVSLPGATRNMMMD